MTTRSNVEIDYCPDCRGVWLDKGELDKLIDLALATNNPVPVQNYSNPQSQPPQGSYANPTGYQSTPNYNQNADYYDQNNNGQFKKKKKEGWLGEMFDF